MMISSKIRFSKSNTTDGFGFNCMKTAYSLRIKGRLDYYPGGENQIIAEGEENSLQDFIAWIKNNIEDTNQFTCHNSLISSGIFKEFDIFLHTAIQPF